MFYLCGRNMISKIYGYAENPGDSYARVDPACFKVSFVPNWMNKFKVSGKNIRVIPILYWISLISRIRWIQLDSVKHDWGLL